MAVQHQPGTDPRLTVVVYEVDRPIAPHDAAQDRVFARGRMPLGAFQPLVLSVGELDRDASLAGTNSTLNRRVGFEVEGRPSSSIIFRILSES
jgi:hypothetical protein